MTGAVGGASGAPAGVEQVRGELTAQLRTLIDRLSTLLTQLQQQPKHCDHGKYPEQPKADPAPVTPGPGTPPPPPPSGEVPPPPPAPGTTPPPPPATSVAGESGGPAQAPNPVQQAPATNVAGATGAPAQAPAQRPAPVQQAPVQQTPVQQSPVQQTPPKGGPTDTSTVDLANVDSRFSAKLTSSTGTAVELWGDPHVVTKIDGVEKTFDIGYGPGSITLGDGSTVRWNTFEPGHARQFILREFSVDSTGTDGDHTVTTDDAQDVSALRTRLTDTQLRELAARLAEYEGPMNQPLALRKPAQQAA